MPLLTVTKIQRFCTHDGPGIRTVVFLKGCPLACRWCHNPETQNGARGFYYIDNRCVSCGLCLSVCPHGARSPGAEQGIDNDKCRGCLQCAENCPAGALQISARDMTVEAVLDEVLKDAAFYGGGGGLTLSGGEPMLQAESTDLLRAAKNKGLHTVVETCGYFDQSRLQPLADADLVLWDIKDTDDARHRQYTGVSNRLIVENLLAFDRLGGKTVLRAIMAKGINLHQEHIEALIALKNRLRHCQGIEPLPLHPYGASKYRQLGLPCGIEADWAPSPQEMEWVRDLLRTQSHLYLF